MMNTSTGTEGFGSNVNLAILRSQLVQSCPSLRNLTITDLETCKWSVRKNIFSNLIESSQAMYDFHIRLEELLERKNKDVTIQKQRNTPREQVIEQEHMFRSSFMNIVLDCLIYTRWPPANEAFSDALGQLLSKDVSFVCSAIAYLATHILPSIPNRNSNPNPRPSSSSSTQNANSPGQNDNLKYEQMSSNVNMNMNMNDISNISDVNTVDSYNLNSMDISGVNTNTDANRNNGNGCGNGSGNGSGNRNNISQTTRSGSGSAHIHTTVSTSGMMGMQYSIEVLQKQNEMLQNRVNNMQVM